MRIKRLNEKISNTEYNDICSNTPLFYPVFVLTDDYSELYTDEDRLITKGTEVYAIDPYEYTSDVKTLCPLNYTTEVPSEILEFVEYRNKKDIDEELKKYKEAKKYNL